MHIQIFMTRYFKQTNNRFKYFKLILLVTVLFSSCKKEPSYLGLDVIPEKDRIKLQLLDAFTYKAGTVSTFSELLSRYTFYPEYAVLGTIKDPVFGTTQASFMTQFTDITVSIPSLDTVKVIDTVRIYLKVQKYFGSDEDKNQLHTIKIYKIKTDTIPWTYVQPLRTHGQGSIYIHRLWFWHSRVLSSATV